jgi:transcriptional/translational regulatory protein YebC/TACO1
LQKKGLEPASAELSKLAENMIKVTGEDASRAMELLEALDDLDDVQNVHTNAEFDPDEIENL